MSFLIVYFANGYPMLMHDMSFPRSDKSKFDTKEEALTYISSLVLQGEHLVDAKVIHESEYEKWLTDQVAKSWDQGKE